VTLIRVSKGALFGIGSSDACTGLTKRVDDQPADALHAGQVAPWRCPIMACGR
jgi:hypothetical protein